MDDADLIPPSPSEEDYIAAQEKAGPPLSEIGGPFALFAEWLEAAKAAEPNDPNGMALATADADGLPDVRMVLLKDVDPRGFVFYTNTESAKGLELAANPQAALLFHWKSLRRQVRVRRPPAAADDGHPYRHDPAASVRRNTRSAVPANRARRSAGEKSAMISA